MGEILGVGCTHRPLMLRPNEDWTFMMRPRSTTRTCPKT